MTHCSGYSNRQQTSSWSAAAEVSGSCFSFFWPSQLAGPLFSHVCQSDSLQEMTFLTLDSMPILEGVLCQPWFWAAGHMLNNCSMSSHCSHVPRVELPLPTLFLDCVFTALSTGWGEWWFFSLGSKGHLHNEHS